jgi:hypothetical protein
LLANLATEAFGVAKQLLDALARGFGEGARLLTE